MLEIIGLYYAYMICDTNDHALYIQVTVLYHHNHFVVSSIFIFVNHRIISLNIWCCIHQYTINHNAFRYWWCPARLVHVSAMRKQWHIFHKCRVSYPHSRGVSPNPTTVYLSNVYLLFIQEILLVVFVRFRLPMWEQGWTIYVDVWVKTCGICHSLNQWRPNVPLKL